MCVLVRFSRPLRICLVFEFGVDFSMARRMETSIAVCEECGGTWRTGEKAKFCTNCGSESLHYECFIHHAKQASIQLVPVEGSDIYRCFVCDPPDEGDDLSVHHIIK